MGVTVCRAVAGETDLELVAAIDPSFAGRQLDEVAGLTGSGLTVASETAALVAAGAEVAVDFTAAARCGREPCVVSPSTASTPSAARRASTDTDVAERLACGILRATAPNCVLAPNFSISAVILMRLAELAAPHFDSAEVIELHHDEKRDAPSGTAIETARRIGAAKQAHGAFAADPDDRGRLPRARGGVEIADGVHIHSVRLPGLVAHEEVLFGAPGQSLTIRQDSYDRTSFMPGVLLAIRRVATLPGFTLGLDDAADL